MQQAKVYLLFHKPKHVVTSLTDPEGRKTVRDFLKGIKYRVFPVGRLDYDSEGLLLLTNDGDFAHALLHPSKEIYKTYHVKVRGSLEEKEIARLQSGIRLRKGITAPAKVKRLKKAEQNSWLEISIHEGKNRQVRKMLEHVRHPVLKLRRIRINGIELGDLSPGRYRYLTHDEIRKIKREIFAQRTH
jgi:23S rRNA pseudouridine2605 synthase